MATAISIPDRLVSRISDAAKKKGFARPEDFVARLIEEKLLEFEEHEKILAITDKVRVGLEAQGISEEDTLNEFESFRQRLYHDRTQGNDNS